MPLSFRPCTQHDQQAAAAMMLKTWHFHLAFSALPSPETPYEAFFLLNMADAEYAEAAVNDDGRVLGFLIATDKTAAASSSGRFPLLWSWICGRYGRRRAAAHVMRIHEKENEAITRAIDHDAEILCFMVDESARGMGVGRQLLSRYEDFCRARNFNKLMLVTDTDCNFGFYDHMGFTRVRSAESELHLPSGEPMVRFVYCKELTERNA